MNDDELTQAVVELGFLSPQIDRLTIQHARQCFPEWFALCGDASVVGQRTMHHGLNAAAGKPLAGPYAFACRLMIRTMSHFQSAVILAERGLPMEAASMARVIHENAILIAALGAAPEMALAHLHAEEHRSELARQKLLLKLLRLQSDIDSASLSRTEERVSYLEENRPTGFKSTAAMAELAGVEVIYLFFRHLSAMASHASVSSLDTYNWVVGEDVHGFQVGPEIERIPRVLGYALHGLTFALVYASPLLDSYEFDGEVTALHDRLTLLNRDLAPEQSAPWAPMPPA